MRLGIGLGLFKAGLISAGVRIFSAFQTRVIGDGGTVEAGTCVVNGINGSALLQQASLLLIPSGYKGGKLYAEIPTNGNGDLTWTRGSDAFRTNASGVLQRVPWNLFGYSEQFDNASWGKLSGTTVTANQATAPNGTLTADLITEGTAVLLYWNNLFSAGTYTQSFYAKKGTGDIVGVYFGSGFTARFNLTSGTIVSTNNTTATISNVGDGWYRITATATPTSNFYAGINYSNSSGLNIYAWGAQLVEGTTAQTYLPTTDRLNFPRLSYMYGSCPAVLLEPQRTNLALWSEEFDSTIWVKQNASITANTTTSPDGSTNADSLIENTTLGQHFTYQQLTKSASSITYAFSVYYKNASGTRNLALGITNGTSSGKGAIFTTSGTITATNATIGSGVGFTFVSADVQSVGNGFYRATIVVTTDTATRVDAVAYLSDSTTSISNYTGNGTSALFIYGAQLEAGAYPTTYIPTTSATATRVADSFSRNNIYTNGLISASGGTWFVEFRGNVAYTRDSIGGVWIGDNTTSGTLGNTLVIRNGGPDRLSIGKTISGTFTSLYTTTTNTTKIAIKWNGSTADIFANGTKVVSATSFTPTNMENLVGNANDVPKFIQQMELFPEPLTDAKLIELTTL